MANDLSGSRLLLVLLFLVSLVSVVAIIVAAVSLTNSDGDTPSISVNSGAGGTGGSSGSSGSSNPIVINNGGSGSISGSKIWRIAVGHDFGAHNYIDDTGYLQGFFNDLIYAVCETGGMDCRPVWDDYVNCWNSEAGKHAYGGQGLFNGWYDACAGWAGTVGRVQVFDFSLAFMKPPSTYSFWVKQSASFDAKDITGKKIGFLDGWAGDEKCLARQTGGIQGNVLPTDDITHYGDSAAAIAAVNAGDVDALFGLDINYKDQGLKQVSTDIGCELQGGSMMTAKDGNFNSYWNAAFQKYRDSGKFSKLCRDSQEAHKDEGLLAPCVDAP